MGDADPRGADLLGVILSYADVTSAQFCVGLSLSEEDKQALISRDAIFDDSYDSLGDP